jgi:hypothetical protein
VAERAARGAWVVRASGVSGVVVDAAATGVGAAWGSGHQPE